MDFSVRKSYWGVTVVTVAVFAGLMALSFLCEMPESVALAAS